MALLDFLKNTVGIDPGSQHLRIVNEGQLIFNEPSRISFDKINNVVSGFGSSVRSTEQDVTITPVDYSICDFQGFETLLRSAVNKGLNLKPSFFSKSYKMYFSIPTTTTDSDKRAYRDSGEHAAAVEVYLVLQSCSSAIGMNLLEQQHFMLIDFGYSKIEMTVFANRVPISVGVFRMGTARIYRLLGNYFRRMHKINVSDREIDAMLTVLRKNDADIKVQHATVKVAEVEEQLDNFFALANDELIETIERIGGHADIGKIMSAGMFFTGGGSAFGFLRDRIMLDNRMKRTVSQNPLLDNINGVNKIIADRERFGSYIMI